MLRFALRAEMEAVLSEKAFGVLYLVGDDDVVDETTVAKQLEEGVV